jgi:murein DD-endopeptidase MepM/ murein hydrolase activator NlpD
MRPRGPLGEISPVNRTASFAADSVYFVTNPLMVPVLGIGPAKVPDTFNASRDGGERVHRATDILAPKGTPVLAASAGKILRMSENHLGGITIYMLDAHQRFLYYYAHLDHYAGDISPGTSVFQGEVLGYVGMTGNAPVTHLHFQAMRWDPSRHDYWNCDPVDVRQFFTLPGKEEDNAP